MMMNTKLAFAGIALIALGACDLASQTSPLDTARTTARTGAKAIVTPIVAETIPGPAGIVVTDCIIDNASDEELVQIALNGNTPEMVGLVSTILQRPETVTCATSGLT